MPTIPTGESLKSWYVRYRMEWRGNYLPASEEDDNVS